MTRVHAIASLALLLLPGCLSILPMMAPSADDVEDGISSEFDYESRFVTVNGDTIHYVEEGEGAPIVLLHGNPTSAYLWRNVIPRLSEHGRVIAPDMVGFGQSAKPDIEYSFAQHAEYFAGFIQAMKLRNVTLVLHDWGGGVGLDYAIRHQDNVRGIAFMEAVIRPMSWDEATFAERYLFGRLRDPQEGHEILAEDNYFVETMLPMMAGRSLSDVEMEHYRAPFPTVKSRRPIARWPREIPIGGEPQSTVERIGENFEALKRSDLPLLLLYAEPGMIVKPAFRQTLERDLPRMKQVSVGSGIHYLQETQPTRIGNALASWVETLDSRATAEGGARRVR